MKKISFSILNTIFVATLLFSVCVAKATATPNGNSNQTNDGLIQEYFGSVQAKIKANWKPPKDRTSASQVVRFKVLPDGQVANVQTYRSANNPDMDLSGIAAVKTAAPFPKINIAPYNKSGLFMEMTFDYNVFSKKNRPTLQNNQLRSQAQHNFEKGDWQAAAKTLNEGLIQDPNNTAFKNRLSEIYSNEANILAASDSHSTKAIDLAKKAYSLDPNNEAAKKLLPKEWTTLSPSGYSFSVKFPESAKHSSTWNLFGNLDSWAANSNNDLYLVSTYKFNDVTRQLVKTDTGQEGIFKGIADSFFNNSNQGDKILSKKLIKEYHLDGYPAKDYALYVKGTNGQTIFSGQSIFCVTEHYGYSFAALKRPNSQGTIIPFFNSIKITD